MEGCGAGPCKYPSGPPAGLASAGACGGHPRFRRLCRAGDFARRLGFGASQGFAGQRLCKTEMFHPPQTSPAGVNARPTMRNTRAAERGRQAAAGFGGTMRALPPTGGVSERSRYEVPALSAEIVPYKAQGRVLPGFAGYLRGKAAMHPLRLRLAAQPAPLAGEPSGRQAAEMCRGGRERPPYNAEHTGGRAGTAGRRRVRRDDASTAAHRRRFGAQPVRSAGS